MEAIAKNFVGVLNEKCHSTKLPLPQYAESDKVGDQFVIMCQVNELVSQGRGLSKKIAKQHAAKQMLEQIDSAIPSTSEATVCTGYKRSVSIISKIYDYCVKEKKETPIFSELPKEGNLFCCQYKVEDVCVTGKGSSKKEAKENAASAIAEQLGIKKYFEDCNKLNERFIDCNPIQGVHICCTKMKLVPAYVEEVGQKGKALSFKVTCTVGDLKTESVWSLSKRAAKAEAATLMLQLLKNNTPVASPLQQSPEKRATIDEKEEEVDHATKKLKNE